MSTSTAGPSATAPTSSPLFAPQPTTTRTSIDLFPTGPTGTQSAATATVSTSSSGSRAPSLYLIVFLSILVLLLVTSISIAIRAIHFRRRYHRAIARGEVPSGWADNRTTEPYPDSWWRPMVINRFFGVDPDGDHFDAMMRGEWGPHGTGRRRKPKKDYGEVPILYETDLVSGEDGQFGHEASVFWSEKQPLAVAVSSKAQATAFDREFNGEISDIDNRTGTAAHIQVSQLYYNADTTTNTTIASPRDAELIQVRYLIRMPESSAAIQNRNEPDEYGEIISHGPIEMGVWQPRLEMGRTAAQNYAEKSDISHHDDWKP